VKAFPDMIEKATESELKAGFEKHLAETEGQVHRLRQVFEMLGAEPKGTKCPAIDGILKEGSDLMGEIGDEDTMNVGLVAAAQAVEHYEITRYGALIAWASELGHADCIPLFKANLAEEKATDQKLTRLSERRYNPEADGKPAKKPAKNPRAARGVPNPKAGRRRPSAGGPPKSTGGPNELAAQPPSGLPFPLHASSLMMDTAAFPICGGKGQGYEPHAGDRHRTLQGAQERQESPKEEELGTTASACHRARRGSSAKDVRSFLAPPSRSPGGMKRWS
jgi:ferritin-like metal-binding protein YciE